MYFLMDREAEYNKYSGWTGRVEIEQDDNRAWLIVSLPENWCEKVEFYGEVCAYAGYNAGQEYNLQNALEVAHKPYSFGDTAMKFLVEELRHSDVQDLISTIEYYGGSAIIIEYKEDEED